MLAYLQKGGQVVWNFIRPSKKLGWKSFVIMSVLLFTVFLVTTPQAMAFGWDDIAKILASFCLAIATLFLKLTIFLLTFIIQISAYNGYLDSTAVNYGWVMVRDFANMGFVVILLVIAFGTILGLEQYEWKKLMVKFVLAAILVNFSRLICGVMIDIAQVVMVTFVNGIAATAGGNLITMFGADNIMQMTGSADQEVNGSEVFLASVAALGFSALMFGMMLVFIIMLVYRMITLWVLIVLSPLAFVLSVVPNTQKYASEWWNEFGKNVISGPFIVFFLWLSFATVGGGNINSEIAGASVTDVKVQDSNEADKVGETSAGISQAMSWTKMANFAIAIGMLLVGAEKAQQLGVRGGNMMSKATDFAKKAVTIGAGVAAGKWFYNKAAKPAAKWVGMNVPLVGGNAWVRKGKVIKGLAKSGWEIVGKKRDDYAAKKEKEADEKGGLFRKAWTGALVSAVQTQKKADKKADAYMDVAENLSTWHDKNISTSGTAIGQLKTKTGALAEEAKTFSQTKGKGKAMLAREELMEGKGMFSESFNTMENSIRAETNKTKDLEEKYSLAQREVTKAREDAFLKIELEGGVAKDKNGNPDAKMQKDYDRWMSTQKQQAVFTQLLRETEKNKEILAAIAKDKALPEGVPPQFEQAVRASHQKEIEDRMASLTYRESTKMTASLASSIKDAREKNDTPLLNRLLEHQAAALAMNAKRGSEYFEQALQEGCASVGFNESVTAGDFEGMQRKVFSVLLGQKVGNNEGEISLDDADKQLRTSLGNNYDLVMRNLNESFKKAAADGSVNAAGLFNDERVDTKTGRVTYRLNTEADRSTVESSRAYFAQEINPSKVTSLRDMTGKTADGKFADFSTDDQAISHVISSFGNMTVGTKLHNRLVDELNGYVNKEGKIEDQAVRSSFDALLSQFIATKRESAEAFILRMPDAFVDALLKDPGTQNRSVIQEAVNSARSKFNKKKTTDAAIAYPDPDPTANP